MPPFDTLRGPAATAGPPARRATPGRPVRISDGAQHVPDRATFERLARCEAFGGRFGAHELKVLVVGIDGAAPDLYFLNANAFAFHFAFATEVLGAYQDIGEFNARTYSGDERSNIAAVIVADDNRYLLRFWPTDPVCKRHAALALRLVARAMPFAEVELELDLVDAGGVRGAALLAA